MTWSCRQLNRGVTAHYLNITVHLLYSIAKHIYIVLIWPDSSPVFFLISVVLSSLQFAAVSKMEFNQRKLWYCTKLGVIHWNGWKRSFFHSKSGAIWFLLITCFYKTFLCKSQNLTLKELCSVFGNQISRPIWSRIAPISTQVFQE